MWFGPGFLLGVYTSVSRLCHVCVTSCDGIQKECQKTMLQNRRVVTTKCVVLHVVLQHVIQRLILLLHISVHFYLLTSHRHRTERHEWRFDGFQSGLN